MAWADELLCAVHFGNHDEALHLLQQGYPPDGKSNVTISPLHVAVENNDLQMCKLLLDYNADINWCESDGQSPLFTSAGSEISCEIFDFLLMSGGKVGICDMFGRTPLHYIVSYGEVDKVKRLLQVPGILVNATDHESFSSLHHAITAIDIDTEFDDLKSIINLLLDAGADPNLQDDRGFTALHLAVMHELYFVELTKLLLSSCKNIDFTVKSLHGDNFLHLLFNKPLYEEAAVQLLEDLLWGKIVSESVFPLLLNMQNAGGLTPFCLYMSNPFEEEKMFKKLLSLGADVMIGDNIGQTPLMMACFLNNPDYAAALIDHGANVNSQDIFGQSTVYMARSIETVSLLLQHGGDLQTVDRFGRSCLCQNLLVSDLDCVEYLIHNGGNVNQQDKYGSSPLHYAAYADDGDLIKLLLEHKADLCLQDEEGHTTKDVARIHNCKYALQVFQDDENMEPPIGCPSARDQLWCGVYELRHPKETSDTNAQKKLKVSRDVLGGCEGLLKEKSMLLSTHHEENARVCKGVLSLMETVSKRMGEVEELFTTSLLSAGSIAEGTKTGKPDEFDFLFCLTKFTDSCDVMEGEISKTSGLVKARSKMKPPLKAFSQFFDDSGFLLTQNVRLAFNQLLSTVIREKATWENSNFVLNGISDGSEDTERPAFTLQVLWMSCCHKYLHVSVDIVPAIYPSSWWPKHILNPIALPLMTETIKKEGCLLLVLSQEERGPGEDSEFNLRISCVPAERCVTAKLPREVKNAYVLAKALIKDDVCPVVNFTGDGVTTKDHAVHPSSTIKSYMLKNCLFHVLSGDSSLTRGCPGEAPFERNYTKFTVNLTMKIFQKLQQLAVQEKMLPVYFFPNQNILNYEDSVIYNNDPEEIENETHQLATEIGVLCSLILDCLTASL